MNIQGRNRVQPPASWQMPEKKKRAFPRPHLPKLPTVHLNKTAIIGMLLFAVNIAVLGAGYYYLIYLPKQNTPAVQAKKEADKTKKKNDDMFSEVRKQIALPTDEQPVLATVTDRNALQNQQFFKTAQNGDRLLLYKKNKKIYLYRPSTKQVIAQAPLLYVDPTPTAAAVAGASTSAQMTSTAKVLYTSDHN